jgi:N-succinyldiaminopimelate aminotransferase
MTLAHRLDGIPPTIFTTMSALALRTGAVNLGQGFPDADGPASVLAAADRALHSGANQYAPGTGVPALRQAIARHSSGTTGSSSTPTVRSW